MITLSPGVTGIAEKVAASKPNAMLAVYALDETCRWVSPSHEAILGYSFDEMIGRPWTDFVAPEYHDHAALAGDDAVLNGASIEFSIEAVSKSGTRIPMKGKAWIVTEGDGPMDPMNSYLFFQASPRVRKP